MCNVPCIFCGDYEDCEIRSSELIEFYIYSENGKCGETILTKTQAEEFSFMNPELTLITKEANSLIC